MHIYLVSFVFYYPLIISFFWMFSSIIFYFRFERPQKFFNFPDKLLNPPALSIVIPCYNEADNIEETINHALSLDYPFFEIVAVNDGSYDATSKKLDALSVLDARLRVVHLEKNQGKAIALQVGSLFAKHEFLITIDGDALLDPHSAHWLIRHFIDDPRIAAVTGNPRIRNRSTLLGRVQVGEFSAMIGVIKRAQKNFGAIFTASGVITAFRKTSLHQVGYWSSDMLTEDIDMTWKLQCSGWKIIYEPHALVWILTPETLRGLWKQRLRWAMGGAQVCFKYFPVISCTKHKIMWPLFMEMFCSILWSYSLLLIFLLWLVVLLFPEAILPISKSNFFPLHGGKILSFFCMLQFALGIFLDKNYDKELGRTYYWMIWYPLFFWIIHFLSTVVAYPRVLLRPTGKRARWESPDRGFR